MPGSTALGKRTPAHRPDDSRYSPRGAYALVQRMAAQAGNCTLQFLGDSTQTDLYPTSANGPAAPQLVANALGAQFPAYKVQYALYSGSSYPALTTLQAGTTPPVLTDNFNRADGALGQIPNGPVYASGSTLQISGQKITGTTGNLQVDVGPNDATFAWDVTFPPALETTEVRFRAYPRFSDNNNHVRFEFYINASGCFMLMYKIIAGNLIALVGATSVPGVTLGSTWTVSMTRTGLTSSLTINGTTISGTLTPVTDELIAELPDLYLQPLQADWTIDNLVITRQPLNLTVWNGSVPGATAQTAQTNLGTIMPVNSYPHMVVAAFSHNDSLSIGGVRSTLYSLLKDVQDQAPRAQVAVVLQNPRTPNTAQYSYLYSEGLQRSYQVQRLAAQEGWGIINALAAFLANPTFGTDWMNTDGLHPNAAGQAVIAGVMSAHLQAVSAPANQPAPTAKLTKVVLPPAAFQASEGAPALGVQNSIYPAWTMDPTTQGGIVTIADIPASWEAFNILVEYFVPAGTPGSNNGVVWDCAYGPMSSANNGRAGGTISAQTSPTKVTSTVGTTSGYATIVATLATRAQVTGRPLIVRVRRLAADAADTYATAAYLSAVILERAA